jgi:hypothetical protein
MGQHACGPEHLYPPFGSGISISPESGSQSTIRDT